MKSLIEKIKDKREFVFEIIAIILIALFCYSISPKTLQNDTYYTVTIGNLIMENGIDMQDHFSWIEGLPYTYPHWLYDVTMSVIYNFMGWQGIYISVCFMTIILGTAIYLVNKKLNKNQIISFFITIGSMYLLKDYVAARAQLVTFVLYVLVIYLIERFLQKPKIKYALFIILISYLIANLHVAVWPMIFVLSLPYIAEYFISIYTDLIVYRKFRLLIKKCMLKIYKNNKSKIESIQKSIQEIRESNKRRKEFRKKEIPYKVKVVRNKNVKWLILIMLICLLTGFLTPIGLTTPFTYLYKSVTGNMVNNINEHLPLTLASDIPILITILLFLSVLVLTKVKIRLSDLFMLCGLTYLMLKSKRQSTMFVIISGIILNRLLVETLVIYYNENIKVINKRLINIITIVIFIIGTITLSNNYIKNKKDDVYISKNTYPVDAAKWMLENLDINNIKLFNEYNYGSYLLYCGIPVFIDSRCDLYNPEYNDNKDIFMDFINTSGIAEYYGSTFERYEITHVLLYKNSKISMLIDKADSEKYNKIYRDDNFVIYEVIRK